MIANFFWSGNNFQYLDRLTILSHLIVGHKVTIWLWGPTPNSIYWPSDIPDVRVKDANEIVSCDEFYKSISHNYSEGKRFRITGDHWKYNFMYKQGGLYCDCDAIALKHFPSDEWISVLGTGNVYYVGVMKAPPKHSVFKFCIENVKPKWGNPRVYTEAVKKFDMHPTHDTSLFYPFTGADNSEHINEHGTIILLSNGEIPDAFSIHAFGNKSSTFNVDQDIVNNYPDSILYKLSNWVFKHYEVTND